MLETLGIIWNDTSLISTIISFALIIVVFIWLGALAYCLAQPKIKNKIISMMCIIPLFLIVGNFIYPMLENYAEKIQNIEIENKGNTKVINIQPN